MASDGLILQWQGKQLYQHRMPVPRMLDEVPEFSVGQHHLNMIIEGDNLQVLAALKSRYAGQLDVIYIDPPWHRLSTPPEVVAALPPEKQAYFRRAWARDHSTFPSSPNTVEDFIARGEPPLEGDPACHRHSHEAPFLRGLDRLADANRPARLRIAVRLDPQPFAQGGTDEFSPTIIPPDADVVVDRLPRRELVGQEAPVTAGP